MDLESDIPHDGPIRHSQHPESSSTESPVPVAHIGTPKLPTIHLRIHPITHQGAKTFTNEVPDIGSILENAVHTCWKHLYNNENHLLPRNVRSITLFVRPMSGVAY